MSALPPTHSPVRWSPWLLVALVLAVFGRAVTYDFIWDDEIHVSRNPLLNPFTIDSLRAIWTQPYENLYIPLAYTAWGLLSLLAGTENTGVGVELRPVAFHGANLLLHAGNALIVWRILRRLGADDIPALLGAAVFALHPLQTETVAWVSGFRDLLSATLGLAAIDRYLHRDRRRVGTYLAVGGLYTLALLAKPSAAPVVVIAWLCGLLAAPPVDRADAGRRALRLSPLLLPGLAVLLLTRVIQQTPALDVALWHRPVVAWDAVGWYLSKLIAPIHLCIDAGRSPTRVIGHDVSWWPWIMPILAIVLLMWRRRDQWLWIGSAIALAWLGPVLGLTTFLFQQFSTVADRYTYLALLGVAVVVARVVSQSRTAGGVMIAFACVCAGLSVVQTGHWKDAESLYRHTLAVNPNSALSLGNLGTQYALQRRFDQALPLLRRAVELTPGDPDAHDNYAAILDLTGDSTAADRARATAAELRARLSKQ